MDPPRVRGFDGQRCRLAGTTKRSQGRPADRAGSAGHSRPGTAAQTYLADKDRAESANRENAGYQRIKLDDLPPPASGQSAAELEYTHGSGNLRFHYQTRAFAGPRSVYVLTFSLYANDERTLQAQWQAVQPTLTTIRDSFRITAQG